MGETETQELGGPPLNPKKVVYADPLRIPEEDLSFKPLPNLKDMIKSR